MHSSYIFNAIKRKLIMITHCKYFQLQGYTLTPAHPNTSLKQRNICWLFFVLISQGRAFTEIMDQHLSPEPLMIWMPSGCFC